MRWGLIVAALLVASPAGAQSLQADYDAAQAALSRTDFATAVPGFESVLARMAKQAANPRNRAVATVRTQYATALMGLGRTEEAAGMYEKALPGFEGGTPDDRNNLAVTWSALGRARELLLDYSGARDAYRSALATGAFPASDLDTVGAQFGLGRVTMFSDPAAARAAMDAALPYVPALYAGLKDRLGEVYSLRGRIELNDGKPAAARDWFNKALSAAGGLTTRVSLSDIRIRGDLALASFALPSGNIACTMSDAGAKCTIASITFAPPTDAACTGTIGHVFEVGADGVRIPCVDGPAPGVAPAGTPQLEYGTSSTVGGYTCTSSTNGVRCVENATGRGFELARGKYAELP